jgi:photosystem II stability/assembly factor-like uncharacterized protein
MIWRGTCLLALFPAVQAAAQGLSPELQETFTWRSIGPAAFGGRVVDVALHPDDRDFMLVASASGGLFRTLNHGTTWQCIFEREGTISLGDVALDPTDNKVIWVGTGEANNQRSSYWGDGVYKTTDGGETWVNTGLRDSHHIGRIVIDPADPQRVFVAALGHLYSPNAERGLYRTTDGGETWQSVLHVSEDVGVVDVVIDPKDSSRVYAATYERRRRAWNFDGNGPGSGIWRSTDGGDSFERLEGGLPGGDIGRIGLAIYPKDPSILYATVANQNETLVEPKPEASFKTRYKDGRLVVRSVLRDGGAKELGLVKGDVLLKLGEVELTSALAGVQALVRYKGVDEAVELVLTREGESLTLELKVADLLRTPEREPRYRSPGGEVYKTVDGGDTWVKVNKRAAGGSPAYYYGQIRVDPNDPEVVYQTSVPFMQSTDGGQTWGGNLAGGVHVDHHAVAIDPNDSNFIVLGNDGGLHFSYDRGETWRLIDNLPISQFYAVGVDMASPYNVYGGTQDNGTWGGPSRSRSSAGIGNREWTSVGGGDGFYAVPDPRDPTTVYAESQFGSLYRRDVESWRTEYIRPPQDEQHESYRFNWNSPIVVSGHNSEIIYFGGNRLFKSLDRGDSWPIVSEDLTTADPEKLEGNVPHCTLTTIAESPFDPNCVLVGSDDGLVQLTRDGCLTFTNLTGRFPGVPSNWWVNRVEFSPHDEATAYVVFTGYREDDFRAFVYKTTDGCETWTSISEGVPDEGVNVIREDPVVPGVLYLGTELGAYVSLDGGQSWATLGAGLPTLPVYDLVVHPRDGEVVIGTHGRGFWILDVRLLRQFAGEGLGETSRLFEVGDVMRLQRRNLFGWRGQGNYFGENPKDEARVGLWLAKDVGEKDLGLWIEDVAGEKLRDLKPSAEAGFQVVTWNLRGASQEEQTGRRRRGSRLAAAGTYSAVLRVGEQVFRQRFELTGDPLLGGRMAEAEDEVDTFAREDD